jgi:hypothetical protein
MKSSSSFSITLKILTLLISLSMALAQSVLAANTDTTKETQTTSKEQEIISLSKEKWKWMSERNIDKLENLFEEKAVFVHMGGTMSRQQEIDVIKSGGIHYKKADIHDVSVNIIGNTAICLNRITLLAVVGGNEVTNPFVVTEVYVQVNSEWKLAALSFTRLLTP